VRRIAVSVAAAVAMAAIILVPAHGKTAGLKGEVGPGFDIEVKKGSVDVKRIKAGTYKMPIEDKSSAHNFHLKGPGVNKKTGVGFVGKKTWTVTLKPGKYTYQCDPHATAGMKGTFRVT